MDSHERVSAQAYSMPFREMHWLEGSIQCTTNPDKYDLLCLEGIVLSEVPEAGWGLRPHLFLSRCCQLQNPPVSCGFADASGFVVQLRVWSGSR